MCINHVNNLERLLGTASFLSLSPSLFLSLFSFVWFCVNVIVVCILYSDDPTDHHFSYCFYYYLFVISRLLFIRSLFFDRSYDFFSVWVCLCVCMYFCYWSCISNIFICLRLDCRIWTRMRARTPNNVPLWLASIYTHSLSLAIFRFTYAVSKESVLFSINLSAIHVTVFVFVY